MREHEVPTHLQAEDRVLLGLTFPQLVSAAAAIGLAYGLFRISAGLLPGEIRLALAALVGVGGLVLVVVRPGGRTLVGMASDLLRFALLPKRYQGSLGDLLDPPEPPPTAAAETATPPRRRQVKRFVPWLGVIVAFLSVATIFAGHSALAASGSPQLLFIDKLSVTADQAVIEVRAATSLDVTVSAETVDGQQTFRNADVLYQGESRTYDVPLNGEFKEVLIGWRDAVGDTGVRILDASDLPHPLPTASAGDCSVQVAQVDWTPGGLSGTLGSACHSSASEQMSATILEDPGDPSAAVQRDLTVDTKVENISGSVDVTASGPGGSRSAQVAFRPGAATPFSMPLPAGGGLYRVSLADAFTAAHAGMLPGYVQINHVPATTDTKTVVVAAWFAGFTTHVSATLHAVWQPVTTYLSTTLSAVWQPFQTTVMATLSTWFAPVTRVLSATLSATWSAFTQTVGTWVSSTVGAWLSTLVSTHVWTTVSTWLSATVGTWLSTTVGAWLSTLVSTHVWTVVTAFLSTTVGSWVSGIVTGQVWAVVGTWVTATVGRWLSATVGAVVGRYVGGFYTTVTAWAGDLLRWLHLSVFVPQSWASGYASASASGYASGSASGYASGEASGYASGQASGYAQGTASGYAAGIASGDASGMATGYASGQASAYAQGTASGYASGIASGDASGVASGYAQTTASGYASTQVAIPGRTAQRTVSQSVTSPGQSESQTVSQNVEVPGRTAQQTVGQNVTLPGKSAAQTVSKDIETQGKTVTQDVTVTVVVPGYASASTTPEQPFSHVVHEEISVAFPIVTDAPYQAVASAGASSSGSDGSGPNVDGTSGFQVDQYVALVDQLQQQERIQSVGNGGATSTNQYKLAFDHVQNDNYFELHPDEAAQLRALLFQRWMDSLTIALPGKNVMGENAGGIVSSKDLTESQLPAGSRSGQSLISELAGSPLQ